MHSVGEEKQGDSYNEEIETWSKYKEIEKNGEVLSHIYYISCL